MAGNSFNWIKYYRLELIVILLGLLHQVFQKILHLKLGWIDNYGDDLLAVPFVSACVLILENALFYKNHQRKHSFGQLLFLFVFITIFFEFIAPRYSDHYTYDPMDVLYYFFGFLFILLNLKIKFFLSFKFNNPKASQ